ncbi:MAG: hypothetical protein COV99_10510 [Bacteroidetes bacterium CG12_big_fil_rev_8_21_14_0_65_60_17]|nr:MAG: hypothetical protein COV99_10510 [Bacteroidetes bacterium CG12_big_fil_rev_8_21_14_0_65_60_17]
MKQHISLLAILIFIVSVAPGNSHAQQLRDKDLVDTRWKLHLGIGIDTDADEDNAISRAALAMATSLIAEIDIEFHFMADGDLVIRSKSGADTDQEYSAWYIDQEGQLVIGDTDSFSTGSDTVWIQEEGILVAHVESNRKARIWLEQIPTK